MNKEDIAVKMANRLFDKHFNPIIDDIKDNDIKIVFLSTLLLKTCAILDVKIDDPEVFSDYLDKLINVVKEVSANGAEHQEGTS